MSYTFVVNIPDPSDVTFLIQNGYNLAIQKATAGSSQPVQWIGYPVSGAQIQVAWSPEYLVYYTLTALQNGAVITTSTTTAANLALNYNFFQGVFTQSGKAADNKSIRITNLNASNNNFGLAQPSSVGGVTATSVAGILAGGYADFTPSETITVYFTNTQKQGGTIINAHGTTYVATIQAGVTNVWYQTGVWYTSPPASVFLQVKEATERLEKHGHEHHRRYLLE